MSEENWDEPSSVGGGAFAISKSAEQSGGGGDEGESKPFGGFGGSGLGGFGDGGGFRKREGGGGFEQRRGGGGGGFGSRERGNGFGGGFGSGGGDRPRFGESRDRENGGGGGGFGGDRGDRPPRRGGGFGSFGGFGDRANGEGGSGGFGGGGFGGGDRSDRPPRRGGGFGSDGFAERANGEEGRGFGSGGFGDSDRGDRPRRGGGFGGGGFGDRANDGGSGGGFGGGGFSGRRQRNDGDGDGDAGGERRGGFGGGRGGGFGSRGGDGFAKRDSGQNDDGGQDGGERKGFGFGGGFGGGRGGREDGGERRGGFGRREGGDGGGGFGTSREGGEERRGRNFGGGHEGKDQNNRDGSERREIYMPKYDDVSEDALFQHITVGINFAKQNEIPANLSGEGWEQVKPLEKFEDADLSDLLLANIRRCEYTTPTPVQKYSIPIVLAKRDLMACAQTGSGKTAAYLVPIMTNILNDGVESSGLMAVQSPQALILSPTRELALQIFQECKKFSHGSIIKSAILYGGVTTKYQVDIMNRGCNILIATPGRLLDILERGQVSLEKIKYFVLDEADRMLDLGFEKSVRTILEKGKVNQKANRCTLMYSATFPSAIQKLAQDFLNNYLFLAIGQVGGANKDVEQVVYKVGRFEKRDKVVQLINEIGNERTMIFLEHKKQADILAFYLLQQKYPSTSIHGDRLQSQREAALADFRSGKAKIIVCTSVAARGLDIDGVSYVINYDLPKTIDEYVHRIGRTGRCGNLGKSISFFDPESENDRVLTRSLVMTLREAEQTVPDWLNEMAEDSKGASYMRDIGVDDLRENMCKINLEINQPAASQAAAGGEEAWD